MACRVWAAAGLLWLDKWLRMRRTRVIARLGPPAGLAYEAVRHVHNDVVSDVSCVGAGDAWRCSRVGAATSVAG